jgi:hypothetical protein
VSLPGLVSREAAEELLAHLKDVTGIHRDELAADDPESEAVIEHIREKGRGNIFFMSRLQDATVWDFVTSRALGRASAELTGKGPMRLFTDGVICKLPLWTDETLHAGLTTGVTPWHQDFGPVPWDRPFGVQFWLALCEITPEMGSMQHLTGSHREGPLGCQHYSADQNVRDQFPELWEKHSVSEAHHFQPGDVLAHNPLTVHYAQANQTDRLRWVYTSYRVTADTLYNGIPNERFEEFGFTPWKTFDHPKFPIVSE